jgi:hypothetical protein
MSLFVFQKILSDAVADPEFCRKLKYQPDHLANYELTPGEVSRLQHIFNQKGMEINCMLYQINRLGPLIDLMPYIVRLLKRDLKKYTRGFWDEYKKTGFQFRDEVILFGEYLKRQLDLDRILIPYFNEILTFEITYNYIRFSVFPDNSKDLFCKYYPSLPNNVRMVFMKYNLSQIMEDVISQPKGDVVFKEIEEVHAYFLVKFSGRVEMIQIDNTTLQGIQYGFADNKPLKLVQEKYLIS